MSSAWSRRDLSLKHPLGRRWRRSRAGKASKRRQRGGALTERELRTLFKGLYKESAVIESKIQRLRIDFLREELAEVSYFPIRRRFIYRYIIFHARILLMSTIDSLPSYIHQPGEFLPGDE